MHNHGSCCKHEEVKYCGVCKLVYCVKCGEEWGKRDYTWTWTYPTYPTYPTGTYPTYNNTGTVSGWTPLDTGSTHAHK